MTFEKQLFGKTINKVLLGFIRFFSGCAGARAVSWSSGLSLVRFSAANYSVLIAPNLSAAAVVAALIYWTA